MNIRQSDCYTSDDAPGYSVHIENNGDNIVIEKNDEFFGEIVTDDESDQVPLIILQTLSFLPK